MAKKPIIILLLLSLFLSLSSPALAETSTLPSKQIKINIPSYRLVFYEGQEVVKEYPIAIGKPSSPTPTGQFFVINKAVNPTWYPPRGGDPVPTGPSNPLGYRWIGIYPGYGIHGNNNYSSIGKAVSLGCIRLHNHDVEELFPLVDRNVPVFIEYETLNVELFSTGEVKITLYPDVYNKGVNKANTIQNQLEQLGYGDRLEYKDLQQLIESSRSYPVSLMRGFNLYKDDLIVVRNIVFKNDEILIPASAIIELFKQRFWEEISEEEWYAKVNQMEIVVHNEVEYYKGAGLEQILGMEMEWDEINIRLLLKSIQLVSLEDRIASQMIVRDYTVYIPIIPLAKEYWLEPVYYPDKQIVLLGEGRLPYLTWDGVRYVELDQVNKQLGLDLEYNR